MQADISKTAILAGKEGEKYILELDIVQPSQQFVNTGFENREFVPA